MFRYVARLILCGVVLSLCGAGVYSFAESNRCESGMTDLLQEQVRLDHAMDKMRVFRSELITTFSEVYDEEMSLAEAIDHVEEIARNRYPDFLKFLAANRKVQGGLKEKIADNVIGYFVAEMADKKCDKERLAQVVARLRAEQSTLFSEHHTVSAEH